MQRDKSWALGPEWTQGLCTVKQYGDRYKLTVHKCRTRTPGLELDGDGARGRAPPSDNGGRLAASVSRTRATVHELALCNPWEYFSTWTLADDRGFDRYDLRPWYKDFSQWIRNQRRITGAELAYLVVPECHKDGAWHLHGLWHGMPMDRLRQLQPTNYLPYRLLDKLKDGRPLYSWPAYQDKYGWCTLEPIRDKDRCATYIAKYITKAFVADMRQTLPADATAGEPIKEKVFSVASLPPGAKLYYASQGLKRATEIWRGKVYTPPDYEWDYENDYVCVSWSDTPDTWLDGEDMAATPMTKGGFYYGQ